MLIRLKDGETLQAFGEQTALDLQVLFGISEARASKTLGLVRHVTRSPWFDAARFGNGATIEVPEEQASVPA